MLRRTRKGRYVSATAGTVSGVIPRYVYDYVDALQVNTRRTVSFQGKCRCGWQGKWEAERSAAMDAYQAHKRDQHKDGR